MANKKIDKTLRSQLDRHARRRAANAPRPRKLKTDLIADDHDPKDAKILISINLPGHLIMAYKAEAARRGTKYQTLMNEVLEAKLRFFGDNTSVDVEALLSSAGEMRDLLQKFFPEVPAGEAKSKTRKIG